MSDANAEHGAAVTVTNAEKTYHLGEPLRALDRVSLSIPHGSYTAVMGPSGSGKSTLMNLIGTLDTPTSGSIEIDGHDVTQLSDQERTTLRGNTIGFVFQTFNLMPRLTARENVELPLVFQGVSRRPRRDRAVDLLEQVGLADRTGHRPNQLSGGQRQRVSVARALANDPKIVLADEPTGNLDTDTGTRIMELLQRLHERNRSIVVVTHERTIAEHAERIVHLSDGTVERIETVDGTSSQPHAPQEAP